MYALSICTCVKQKMICSAHLLLLNFQEFSKRQYDYTQSLLRIFRFVLQMRLRVNLVSLQVKVSNPSTKALTYNILLAGRDARDFTVPRGSSVTIPARQTVPLSVEFTSRYLRPAEATLVLIGTRQGANMGTTLTFKLRTQIDNITPAVSVCLSCCLPCPCS